EWVRATYQWTSAGHRVVLLGIDTNEYDTSQVTSRIDTLVSTMQANSIARIVLNLSFVVAPCDVKQWIDDAMTQRGRYPDPNVIYGAYQNAIAGNSLLTQFQTKLDGIVKDNSLSVKAKADELWSVAEVRDQLAPTDLLFLFYSTLEVAGLSSMLGKDWPVAGDPLYEKLADLVKLGPKRVVPVGAAGNGMSYKAANGLLHFFQLDFPFAPAMWDSVVSVSSAPRPTEQGLNRAAYANSGEVTQDGHLTYTAPTNTTPYELDGTSFAAP